MPDNQQSALTARRQSNPVAQYVLSLAAAVAAYSLYVMFAVPLLEGPANQVQARRAVSSIDITPRKRDKSWLKPFVPADGWELESCKTVAVEGGTILFRDYQPLDDGYAEVFPFTLILNAKPPRSDDTRAHFENADETPVAVRCQQKARLKFDRPLAESISGGGLKLEVARLVGEVTIYRPPSAVGATDSISVVTRNIQFEPTQIFTLEEVQFAFGKNAGTGRHLRIELQRSQRPTANPLASAGFSAVTGINRIELASLQKLRLESTRTPAIQHQKSNGATPQDKRGSDLFSNNQSPVQVSCLGPFAFDFQTKTATLEDQVLVEQLDQYRDRLTCDQLTLTFGDEPNSDPTSDQSGTNLRTFHAQGMPAEVISHSQNTKITGDQLFYNVLERQFQAVSTYQVTVATPQFQLVSRQLSYSVPADGSMGPVDARGPGRLLRPATAEHDPMLIQWQKQLTVSPDGVQQHVVIDGKSNVHLGNDTSLIADQIELWLIRDKNQNPVQTLATGTQRKPESWNPTRVMATGEVRIKTPELNGTTEQLTAIWQGIGQVDIRPIQAQPPSSNANANATTFDTKRHTAARVVQAGWISDPPVARVAMQRIEQSANFKPNPFVGVPVQAQLAAKPVSNRIAQNQDGRKQSIDFRGNQVDVQLKRVGAKTEIVNLKVDGNVHVTQTSAATHGSKTNTISGTQLRLVPQANDQQRIQVTGTVDQLATFRSNELNLDGQEIFVDQQANRIWVDGPGKVWLNPNESNRMAAGHLPSIKTPPDAASKRGSISQLEVSWAAGMIFDGRKIYFEKDVAMTAESSSDQDQQINKSRSFSQGLNIKLSEEIRLTSTDHKHADVKIEEVVLVDRIAEDQQVFQLAGENNTSPEFQLASSSGGTPTSLRTPIVIENQTFDANGKILERQTVIAPQANYSVSGGKIRAAGPGSIQLHRRGKVKAFDSSKNTASKKPSNPNAITLTHVKFDDRLIADSNKKEMQIHGQVRSLTSPVKSFDEVFDPDRETHTWPADAVKLVCQQVQLAQWNPQASGKPSNEMIATGNAHITSSQFEATADRVSYSQANDMLVVEGTPRSDANLWFRRNPAARPDHLVAGKILYRLSDQWTEVQNVRNVKIKSK